MESEEYRTRVSGGVFKRGRQSDTSTSLLEEASKPRLVDLNF